MLRARTFYLLTGLLAGALAGAGCSGGEDGAGAAGQTQGEPSPGTAAPSPEPPTTTSAAATPAEATPSEPTPTPATAAPRFAAPQAGEQVDIPAGSVLVGSRPGLRFRSPRREADLVSVEVLGFRIDRLPYPNDPTQPARTSVTRQQAETLCSERGQRLCHELEWERACKAESTHDYVTGATFARDACRDDYASCTSPLGVSALGVHVAEWSATPAPRDLRVDAASWIVRGASADAEAPEHRCGARHVVDPGAPSARIGFRCCGGPVPELRYPAHPQHELHELVEADDATLAGYLRQMPEVARFAEGFRGSTSAHATAVLTLASKSEEDLAGWRPFTGVLRWTPTEGEHVWVFSGAGGGSSLIVVAHPMPDGRLVHGASFVFERETPPVLVAYSPSTPNALKWSTCWDCAGEGGVIMMREGRVTIAQR